VGRLGPVTRVLQLDEEFVGEFLALMAVLTVFWITIVEAQLKLK
jgi:hypothetical protein